ncbi:hypothetical protein A0J61_11123, partial [Choanephora cucurbitarum]
VLKRRIHTYEKHKHRLEANYGTIKECKAVLISEMISDQEDEYDADNDECDKFFDELDNIRNNNSKAKNRHFKPIKKGSRTLKTSHSAN